MNRREFLHCHMCKQCYSHKCADMSGMTISLCKQFRWPTYKMNCPYYEEVDKNECNWARNELELMEKNDTNRS